MLFHINSTTLLSLPLHLTIFKVQFRQRRLEYLQNHHVHNINGLTQLTPSSASDAYVVVVVTIVVVVVTGVVVIIVVVIVIVIILIVVVVWWW